MATIREVACAGEDHAAALYLPPIAGIGVVKPRSAKTGRPTVAVALDRIAELIDQRGGA